MKFRSIGLSLALSTTLVAGTIAVSTPARADNCYSWNKDTPACGWYGPPAPNVPFSCKLGAATTMVALLSGQWWAAAVGGTGTVAGCTGN